MQEYLHILVVNKGIPWVLRPYSVNKNPVYMKTSEYSNVKADRAVQKKICVLTMELLIYSFRSNALSL